jgi:hypothetical protein
LGAGGRKVVWSGCGFIASIVLELVAAVKDMLGT